MHDGMILHRSGSNESGLWRHAVILRFISAEALVGSGEYVDYTDKGQTIFPREYFLVQGADPHNRGMRADPFEPGPGYGGDPRWLAWLRRKEAPPPSFRLDIVSEGFEFSDAKLGQLRQDGFALETERPFLTPEGLEWCRANLDRCVSQLISGDREREAESAAAAETARSLAGREGERMRPADLFSIHQRPGGEWLWPLLVHPAVLAAARAQIGPDVVLWSTHLLVKEPREGEAIPLHQDAPCVAHQLAAGRIS